MAGATRFIDLTAEFVEQFQQLEARLAEQDHASPQEGEALRELQERLSACQQERRRQDEELQKLREGLAQAQAQCRQLREELQSAHSAIPSVLSNAVEPPPVSDELVEVCRERDELQETVERLTQELAAAREEHVGPPADAPVPQNAAAQIRELEERIQQLAQHNKRLIEATRRQS